MNYVLQIAKFRIAKWLCFRTVCISFSTRPGAKFNSIIHQHQHHHFSTENYRFLRARYLHNRVEERDGEQHLAPLTCEMTPARTKHRELEEISP